MKNILFLFFLNLPLFAFPQSDSIRINLLLLVDGEVIDYLPQSTAFINNVKFKSLYRPLNFQVKNDTFFTDINKIQFSFSYSPKYRKDYNNYNKYEIPIYMAWSNLEYVIISIYSGNTKHYKRLYGKKNKAKYGYTIQYPSGSIVVSLPIR